MTLNECHGQAGAVDLLRDLDSSIAHRARIKSGDPAAERERSVDSARQSFSEVMFLEHMPAADGTMCGAAPNFCLNANRENAQQDAQHIDL